MLDHIMHLLVILVILFLLYRNIEKKSSVSHLCREFLAVRMAYIIVTSIGPVDHSVKQVISPESERHHQRYHAPTRL